MSEVNKLEALRDLVGFFDALISVRHHIEDSKLQKHTVTDGGEEVKIHLRNGLCNAVEEYLSHYGVSMFLTEVYIRDVFRKAKECWSEGTGNEAYVVPSYIGNKSPFDAEEIYDEYLNNGYNMWSTDAYGKARWLLVIHVKEYVEALITQLELEEANNAKPTHDD